MTVIERLAEFVVEEGDGLPFDELASHGKRALIDWFAAVVPGGIEAPASVLRRTLDDELGRGEALLYPEVDRAPARTSALLNGVASHTLEVDDIYRDGILHPGCTVIPAALAVAQRENAPGSALLRAVILGYEVAGRIAVSVNPAHYRFWHTTGTVGGIGAAAAVGTLVGLDAQRMSWALAHAGTLGAGLKQAFRSGSQSKPVHAGHAAATGVLSAALAAGGTRGAVDLLEGERGFGRAMSDGGDWLGAMDGLGEQYVVAAITVKKHACCGHTFAAIDAALALQERHAVSPDDLARITVGTYGTAVEVTGNPHPEGPDAARFSLPYVVAWSVVHGPVDVEAFSSDALADPTVRAVMERVELEVIPEFDEVFPKRRGARVEIETTEGKTYEWTQRTRKGDPDAPLSDEELNAKFRQLVEPVMGEGEARSLLDRLWKLDEVSSVRQLGTGSAVEVSGGV